MAISCSLIDTGSDRQDGEKLKTNFIHAGEMPSSSCAVHEPLKH